MNFIRKAFVILLMASICCIQAGAQSLNVDDEKYRWEGDVSFGFNTDGGQFDFGAYYFLNDYVGFNLRLGMSMDPDCTADFITDAILPDDVVEF